MMTSRAVTIDPRMALSIGAMRSTSPTLPWADCTRVP